MKEALLKLWCAGTSRTYQIRHGERGATAVEYGIMIALIAVVIIAAVQALGGNLVNAFEEASNAFGGE